MILSSSHRYLHIARWSLPRALPILLLSTGIVLLNHVVRFHLAATTLPISILGTAVAFYVGFKNNQAYDRFWEARTAWGAIVNTSRAFAVGALDHVRAPTGSGITAGDVSGIQRALVLRHLAWVNALRLALRRQHSWDELSRFLPADELAEAKRQPNVPTYLLRVQSRAIEDLVDRGLVSGVGRHLDFRVVIRNLYDHEGTCERIKNTPLVPHYTAAATLLVWLYIVLIPFSLLNVLEGETTIWAVVPIATLIGWLYDTMDRIGRLTENPFDNQPTDVPMCALCRTIEIDLLAMLGERELPLPVKPREMILD
ncbi:MAG TPA: bestrophin family ion channel [Labilithrix sp.]|nr:bestrophin family ion channel [Labilithrix sp.]